MTNTDGLRPTTAAAAQEPADLSNANAEFERLTRRDSQDPSSESDLSFFRTGYRCALAATSTMPTSGAAVKEEPMIEESVIELIESKSADSSDVEPIYLYKRRWKAIAAILRRATPHPPTAEPVDPAYPFYELKFIMRVLSHKGGAPKQDWDTAYGMAREIFSRWHKDRQSTAEGQTKQGRAEGESLTSARLCGLKPNTEKTKCTTKRTLLPAPTVTTSTPPMK